MATNFRITTEYVFELFNPDSNNGQGGYHQIWITGDGDNLAISASQYPDLVGIELELENNTIPAVPTGTNTNNYRFDNVGNFQLYNVDNGLWYNVWIKGILESPPQLYIYQEGAD